MDGDVVLVGLGKCGEEWVIHIGVQSTDARIPVRGPNGTPVLAFVQGGVSALEP